MFVNCLERHLVHNRSSKKGGHFYFVSAADHYKPLAGGDTQARAKLNAARNVGTEELFTLYGQTCHNVQI